MQRRLNGGVLRFTGQEVFVIASDVCLFHVVDCVNLVLRVVIPIAKKANKYIRYITVFYLITYLNFIFC